MFLLSFYLIINFLISTIPITITARPVVIDIISITGACLSSPPVSSVISTVSAMNSSASGVMWLIGTEANVAYDCTVCKFPSVEFLFSVPVSLVFTPLVG